MFKQVLEIRRKALGPDQRMGEYAEAESRLTETLEIYQKKLGPEHPLSATSLNNLAEP